MLPPPADHEQADRAPTSAELLTSVAFIRGFMSSKVGLKRGQFVLKVYDVILWVSGLLVFTNFVTWILNSTTSHRPVCLAWLPFFSLDSVVIWSMDSILVSFC